MAEHTTIEWCDATWSPWEGCTKVSPGCDNCYAEGMNRWLHKGENWGPGAPRREYRDVHWQKPLAWNAKAARDGVRRRVFPSVCDPFDNEVDPAWRARFFELIGDTPHLTWLLLTKRIGNAGHAIVEAEHTTRRRGQHACAWLHAWACGEPPANVWLGATVINQQEADRDVPKLLTTPARLRFLSIEPMLGAIDLSTHRGAKALPMSPWIDWVIAGGESGPHARPAHPDWFRSLRDQCDAAGVAFHFKQHGEWLPTAFCDDAAAMLPSRRTVYVRRNGTFHDGSEAVDFFGGDEETAWVGKKAAGRLLDGVEHNGLTAKPT